MKKFTPFLFSSSLILPSFSFAIGLSGIQVSSHLNQPLSAEIQLMAIEGIPLSEIQVTLASSAEYEEVGMERSYELAKVRFTLSRNKSGKSVIVIHSNGPIDEPYLQFLLDIRWPNGKMLRGYTVLLDPPNYKVVAKAISPMHDVKKTSVVKEGITRNAPVDQESAENTTSHAVADKAVLPASLVANTDAAPANNTIPAKSQVIANTPNTHEDKQSQSAPTEAVAAPTTVAPTAKPVIAKKSEPVDSIPTVLQAPDVATMSQATPMKDAAKQPISDEDLDDSPTAQLSAPERLTAKAAPIANTKVSSQAPAPSIPTPAQAPAPSTPAQAPAQSADASATAKSTAPQKAAPQSLKVSAHDSLWNIAKKVQGEAPIDLNQVMIAIKKANPDAFIHNNLNGLKQGAVLTVPNYNMMKSVQTVDAAKSVIAQNAAWKHTDTDKPVHPLANIPAKSVLVTPKPQLNFRVTDIEQTPSLKPNENPGKTPSSAPSPTLSIAASAQTQAQQSDAFLKNSMSDYAKANEVLKKRLSASEQENAQLRAELVKLTETIQEQGIKRQTAKMDVRESPNLPNQVNDVDLDASQDSNISWWIFLILLSASGAAGVWWWQRRHAYTDDAQDQAMATTPSEKPATYGTTPAAQSLRFSKMERTVIEPMAEEELHDDAIEQPKETMADRTGITDDPFATKLDLAHAYVAMEDLESAIPLLREVMESGDEAQRLEAHELLTKLI